jgi:hypothetical protein
MSPPSDRRAAAAVFATAILLSACAQEHPAAPTEFAATFSRAFAGGQNFSTHMTGAEEVPANDSEAQGQATFRLSADGTQLHYRLIVANIENVNQAHIHVGATGANGPFVVFLYGLVPPGGGRIQGVIGEGVITQSDLIARTAIPFGATMAELVALMRAGNTYVNVHTSAGGGAPSGPGNLPPGEVRGQIRPLGPH